MKTVRILQVARAVALATCVLAGPALLGACSGRPAAPEAVYTLLDGTTSQLTALRGRVVLVNFWATTCAVCLHEMPQIVATHRMFQPRGFETLAVAMRYDPPARVSDYALAHRLPFGVVIDLSGEIARQFGPVDATPTSVLIDKQGRIVRRFVGEPDFAALQRLITELLAEA